jgi:hypothetical protein
MPLQVAHHRLGDGLAWRGVPGIACRVQAAAPACACVRLQTVEQLVDQTVDAASYEMVELAVQQGFYAGQHETMHARQQAENNACDFEVSFGLFERPRDGGEDEVRRYPGSERRFARG